MNSVLDQSKPYETVPLSGVDETEIVKLLAGSLSREGVTAKTTRFWNWKHLSSPFGVSYGLAAVSSTNRSLVGLRPLMQWSLQSPLGAIIGAVRPVDTVTHPEWRGVGMFSFLTRAALSQLDLAKVQLVFNTPNSSSLPGYEKLGWKRVAALPIYVGVVSPLKIMQRILGFAQKPGVLRSEDVSRGGVVWGSALNDFTRREILAFAARCECARRPVGLRTIRSEEFLIWRYMQQPNVDYGFFVLRSADDQIDGVAVLRTEVRRGLLGVVLVDMFARDADERAYGSLLSALFGDLRVAFMVAHYPRQSFEARALRRRLFFCAKRMTLAVKVLDEGVLARASALTAQGWDLSFGDLEVF
ncbi:MAG: GNAT family N-acetyltransferase [Thauera sp.]|nr:GNAT family N-acetyltransferase [Thauera sp.]